MATPTIKGQKKRRKRSDVGPARATISARHLTLVVCEKARMRASRKKERKQTNNPREGWEDGTPPPHRDFKERGVVR